MQTSPPLSEALEQFLIHSEAQHTTRNAEGHTLEKDDARADDEGTDFVIVLDEHGNELERFPEEIVWGVEVEGQDD